MSKTQSSSGGGGGGEDGVYSRYNKVMNMAVAEGP